MLPYQRKKPHALPIKLALITGGLMVICVMLALLSANVQIYQMQQQLLEKQLVLSTQWLQQHPRTVSSYPTNEVLTFQPVTPLPDSLLQRLQSPQPILLSRATLQALGWQTNSNSGVIAKMLPNASPLTLIAIPAPKKKLTHLFITTGLYLSLAILCILLSYTFLIHARTLRRLRYINRTAMAIVDGKLDKRIPINPAIQDEFSDLSATLNLMLDKINQLMQGLRQVNNNIAHDLKSPLSRMRSRMEVALLNSRTHEEYESALSHSIDDVDNLLKTFNALLLMGNLDSSARNYQLQDTSLSALFESLAELYEVVAEEKQHRFDSDIARNVHVFANANLLAQAISNLLDNAIKYTPEGGHIQLCLRQTASQAVMTISDNGHGIPKSARQTVFERFTRLDSARQLPGTGLGMSLVKSILNIHHASIQLYDNCPGLRVEIVLRCS